MEQSAILYLRKRDRRYHKAGICYEQLWEAAYGKRSSKDSLPRSSTFLRLTAACKRRTDEADSGMARSQRFLDDGEYLLAFGVQLEADFGEFDLSKSF